MLSNAANTAQNDINSVNWSGIQNQFGNASNNIANQQLNGQSIASGITAAGSNSWTTPGTASSFMNPYINNALASQVGLAQSTLLNPELAGIQQNAAASGALGGDRDQVLQSQAINNFNQSEQNQIAQGMNTAYNTGQQQFNTQNALNLAGQEAGANTQLQAANSNIYGSLAQGQNNLNSISAALSPLSQYTSEAGILSSLPKQGTEQVVQTPNGGMLGGVLGGILGGAGQLLTGIGGLAHGGIVDSGKASHDFVHKAKGGIIPDSGKASTDVERKRKPRSPRPRGRDKHK